MEKGIPAATDVRLKPLALRHWAIRLVAGFALGYLWWSFVAVCWILLATAVFGSFANALEDMPKHSFSALGVAGCITSAYAAFFGGIVGPLALGRTPHERGRIFVSSLHGGLFAAVAGVGLGMAVGGIFWRANPHSINVMWISLALALPLGLLGGLLGGWVNRRT